MVLRPFPSFCPSIIFVYLSASPYLCLFFFFLLLRRPPRSTLFPYTTLFQRLEWLMPWVEVFQPREIWVLQVRRNHQLVGLAPLFVDHWTPKPVVSTLGAYTSDYLDWLIDGRSAGQILQSILDYMDGDALAAAGLELSNVPRGSHLLGPDFPSQGEFEVTPDETCPILRLPKTMEGLR